MFENSQTSERSTRYGRPPLLVASCVVLLLCGAAQAREVDFPKDRPRVSLDVPDGWTMETTPTGLEIQSPEKDSIVMLQVVGRQKADVEAWTKEAGAKFKAFGVTFAKEGGAAAKPVAPSASPAASVAPPLGTVSSTKPAAVASGTPNVPALAAGTPAPAASPSPADTTILTPKAGDSFTFSGAPSLSVPGTAGSNDPIKPGALSLEALTAPSPKAGSSRLSFKTVAFLGTSMHGKPVDAELAIYTLSKDRVLLLMQESRPDDNRSVAIGRSVHRAKGAE